MRRKTKAIKNSKIELSKWVEQYFAELRFSETHHLGLGDIRLTVAQQIELVKKIQKYVKKIS